ncbi:MAG: hypothetical protein KKE41_09675 [Gammaproteobacteria bacterium]|nr:hypothetical protein [Gammaproteobacteria bacterium]
MGALKTMALHTVICALFSTFNLQQELLMSTQTPRNQQMNQQGQNHEADSNASSQRQPGQGGQQRQAEQSTDPRQNPGRQQGGQSDVDSQPERGNQQQGGARNPQKQL